MTWECAAGIILLVAACGPADQPAAQGSASNTRMTSPAAGGLATVDFSCVLPVYGNNGSSFTSFPSRSTTPSAESGYYYDRAVSRWVPVHREAVSPDGLRYAYTEGWSTSPPTPPRVHVADAATQADLRVATMPDVQPFQVVDFTSAGIFLIIAFEGIAPGVWRFDPASGSLVKVSDGYYPPAGAAWLGVVDPSDPGPQLSAMTGAPAPDRIDRRDDAGVATTWFYQPGYRVSWVAFAGSPLLLVDASRQNGPTGGLQEVFWLVDRPGHATRLTFNPEPAERFSGFGSAIADAHGIWIGGPAFLYLARRDGSVLRVLGGPAYPANGCV
jgi:hypothetical protein